MPVACAGSARMACAGTVVSGNGVEPTPSMRSICVIWRIGGTLVIVRNVMSMHAGTGRSIWLRLGLRLVSMPREMAEYHRRWRSEHPEKYAQYEAKRKRKRQLAKEAVNE